MASNLVLRSGRAEDAPRLSQILADTPEAAQWIEGYPVLVAECDGVVVGFAVYRIAAGEGELLNLAVDRAWRRQGIGVLLLKQLLPEAELWHLEVRESNLAAISLYETMGFEEVGKRSRYYRDGEDALLLSRFHAKTAESEMS